MRLACLSPQMSFGGGDGDTCYRYRSSHQLPLFILVLACCYEIWTVSCLSAATGSPESPLWRSSDCTLRSFQTQRIFYVWNLSSLISAAISRDEQAMEFTPMNCSEISATDLVIGISGVEARPRRFPVWMVCHIAALIPLSAWKAVNREDI